MLRYIISILLLTSTLVFAQKNDTIVKKNVHSIRFGIDISKPIISLFNKDTKGIQLVTDYRISKNLYIATEFGYADITDSEDYFNYSTNGTYGKLGVNYNVYNNWAPMDNEIYFGMRYGYASFSQTINAYTINQYGTYFENPTITESTEFSDLNASWLELLAGIEVEIYKNLFMGTSISLKRLISSKEPNNFKNLYIPGFNRVFSNKSGVGFNYTVSYRIPFSKN